MKKFSVLLSVVVTLSCALALANTPKKKLIGKKGSKPVSCETAAKKIVMAQAWTNARDAYADQISEAKKEYADEIKAWVKKGKKGDKPEYDKPDFYGPTFTGLEKDDTDANTYDVTTGENEECMVSYTVKVRPAPSGCSAKITHDEMDCG